MLNKVDIKKEKSSINDGFSSFLFQRQIRVDEKSHSEIKGVTVIFSKIIKIRI